MSMGKRDKERQQDLFVPHDQLPRAPGHVFYVKLNELLAEAEFDRWLESLCGRTMRAAKVVRRRTCSLLHDPCWFQLRWQLGRSQFVTGPIWVHLCYG